MDTGYRYLYPAYSAGAFLLALVLAGFNESLALIQVLIFAGMVFMRRSAMLYAALGGAVVGMLLVIVAPGNAVRAAQLPPRLPILDAIPSTLAQVITLPLQIPISSTLTAFLVGMLVNTSQKVNRRVLAMLWGAGLALIAAAIFPSVWGRTESERMLFIPAMIWVGLCAATGYSLRSAQSSR